MSDHQLRDSYNFLAQTYIQLASCSLQAMGTFLVCVSPIQGSSKITMFFLAVENLWAGEDQQVPVHRPKRLDIFQNTTYKREEKKQKKNSV